MSSAKQSSVDDFGEEVSHPEPRAYHATFVHNNGIYIYGGIDSRIETGVSDSLWTVDCNLLQELEPNISEFKMNPPWKLVNA